MTARGVLGTVLVLAGAGVCARLGLWQIDRWHEKRRLNAALEASLSAPVLDVGGEAAAGAAPRGRRVRVDGRFDESRQVLLSNRSHDGSPGVEVVTPLVLEGGRAAVLVDRGWLYSADAATARPEDCPEPGPRQVLGVAVELRRGAGGQALRPVPGTSATVWSARWLDLDTLSSRLPYALAPWALRELPGPGVPDRPLRLAPRPLDEWTHVSYAAQWFLFGSILLGGSAVLAWSRGTRQSRVGRAAREDVADPDLSRRG